MALSDDRWVEVTPSQFEHETAGLEIIRKLLPDNSPYRAWSNFEFRDSHGRWHEVDLLVLARDGLHLVELKYYSGKLTGNDHVWEHNRRVEASPLLLARRKAQRLASRLQDEARAWVKEKGTEVPDIGRIVPFIQESIFLHHERLECDLSEHSAQGLYGLDTATRQSNLPGISDLLLEPPRNHATVTVQHDRLLPLLMKRMGFVPRRERTAGSWVIQESMLGEGDGWQDWRANHQVDHTQHTRIRFRMAPPGASESTKNEFRKVAKHEYATMSRLQHDGLLRPIDLVESDLGVGLVYPLEDSMQRLDLWLANHPQGIALDTQLSVIRQIAEAINYAHGNAVAHRDLTPESVWVRSHADGSIKVVVSDWASAGLAENNAPTGMPSHGVTALHQSGAVGEARDDSPTHVTYRAPEGTWQASATDRYRLDVFAVGAVAFFVLTGQPPAPSAPALRDRLRTQNGLDVSPELPAAAESLRDVILAATRPSPSERIADLATFLEQLSTAERAPTRSAEPDLDPLNANPGDLLGDRFTLVRRLGQGSTAVGLLVLDKQANNERERVLKVALDDSAARRLRDEAEVLARLNDPRLVRLLDAQITLAGRQVLLLESAGGQTLAEALRERTRMSIDLLQRYGTDLLGALQALDKAGIDHRDIKPANLGIRVARTADKAKHLVLFDFSLSRAAASATDAGTPPYLDPFLGTTDRPNYDSAAERYAAAVVLFEMATGFTPVYGDGAAHPGSIPDEATVNRADLDPSIAKTMAAFFKKALARDSNSRHHTVADMLREWESAFPTSATTIPDNADALAESATVETPLRKSGLSARALSAIEPLGVRTVGDLVAVDPVRLNQLSGAANTTRSEVRARAKEWRARFDDTARGLAPATNSSSLPSPQEAAQLLLDHTGRGRSESRQAIARLILGVGTNLDAFATQAQLAAHLPTPVTTARATQLLTKLQDVWANNTSTRALLNRVDGLVRQRLVELGGVATIGELTEALIAAMSPRTNSTRDSEREEVRLVRGVLRAAFDRQRALVRADTDVEPLHTRRHDGNISLVTTQPPLLDTAESLGREADRMISAETGEDHAMVIPADIVADRLGLLLDGSEVPQPLQDPGRLARLAAATSTRAAASGAAELHHRDLTASRAVSLTLSGVTANQQLSPRAVHGRVKARFPALPALPDRPELDSVINRAGVGLIFNSQIRAYQSVSAAADTTGLDTRQSTHLVADVAPVSTSGVAGQRLRDSRSRRSFLALGVPGHRLERAIRVLVDGFHAQPLDLTEVLLQAVRDQAEASGMRWATVQAADAAPSGTRAANGLAKLVDRAIPKVTAAVQDLMDSGEGRPVLLTEAAPLARYGHLAALTQWTDLTRPRSSAVWLLVPQLRSSQGATLDGKPVTLNSPGQFLSLGTEWIDQRDHTNTSNTSQGETL